MSGVTFNRNRLKLKKLLGIRARLAMLALLLVAPLMFVPFNCHWYTGVAPWLVAVAVKVTAVPAHILVAVAAIPTVGVVTAGATRVAASELMLPQALVIFHVKVYAVLAARPLTTALGSLALEKITPELGVTVQVPDSFKTGLLPFRL